MLDDIVTARPDRDVLLFKLQSREQGDRRLIWIKSDRRCLGHNHFWRVVATGADGMRLVLGLIAVTIAMVTSAAALSPAERRGKTFVVTNCSRCHSVDKVTPSPLKIAPPFRTLHLRYPIDTLEESLAEGIVTGHPTMPVFRLDPVQIYDVISYLKTLE